MRIARVSSCSVCLVRIARVSSCLGLRRLIGGRMHVSSGYVQCLVPLVGTDLDFDVHWIRPPVDWGGGFHPLDGEGQAVLRVRLLHLSQPSWNCLSIWSAEPNGPCLELALSSCLVLLEVPVRIAGVSSCLGEFCADTFWCPVA